MNHRADQDGLLAEVLAEVSPPDFRASLLAETLRRARRQRQIRQARRVAGVLMAISLLAILMAQHFFKPLPVATPVAKKTGRQNYELVRTQPLPAGAVVATKDFAAVKIISSAETIASVATTGGNFRFINDEQLLLLVGATPAALIRTGPNSEELVFVSPDDRKRFFKN